MRCHNFYFLFGETKTKLTDVYTTCHTTNALKICDHKKGGNSFWLLYWDRHLCALWYNPELSPLSSGLKHALLGLEGPNTACPRNSRAGSGPSSARRACLAFSFYRDAFWGISKECLCKPRFLAYKDASQRLSWVHRCKQETLALSHVQMHTGDYAGQVSASVKSLLSSLTEMCPGESPSCASVSKKHITHCPAGSGPC